MWYDRRKSVAAGVREPERMNHNLGAGGLAHMHNKQAYQEEQYQKRMAQDRHRADLERQIEEVRQRRQADMMRKRLEDEEWERKNIPGQQQQQQQQQPQQYVAPRAPPPKSGGEAPVRAFAQGTQYQPYQAAASPAYSSGISFQKPAPLANYSSVRGVDFSSAAGKIKPTRIEPFHISQNSPAGFAAARDFSGPESQLSSMFQGDYLERQLLNNRAQHSSDQSLQAAAAKVNNTDSAGALSHYSGYETAVNTSTLLPDMKQNRGLVMSDLKSHKNNNSDQVNGNQFKLNLQPFNNDVDDKSETRSVFDVPQMSSREVEKSSQPERRILPAEAFEGISFPDLLREAPKEISETANRTVGELENCSELIPPRKHQPQQSAVTPRPPTSASVRSTGTEYDRSYPKGSIRNVYSSQIQSPFTAPSVNTIGSQPGSPVLENLNNSCIINTKGTVFELCSEDEIRRGGLELMISIVSEAEMDENAVMDDSTVDMLIHLMTGSLGGSSLSFNNLKGKIMPKQSWVFSSDRRTVTCRLQPAPAFRISADEVVTITFPFSSISNTRCELSKSCPTTFTIRTLDNDGCL